MFVELRLAELGVTVVRREMGVAVGSEIAETVVEEGCCGAVVGGLAGWQGRRACPNPLVAVGVVGVVLGDGVHDQCPWVRHGKAVHVAVVHSLCPWVGRENVGLAGVVRGLCPWVGRGVAGLDGVVRGPGTWPLVDPVPRQFSNFWGELVLCPGSWEHVGQCHGSSPVSVVPLVFCSLGVVGWPDRPLGLLFARTCWWWGRGSLVPPVRLSRWFSFCSQ